MNALMVLSGGPAGVASQQQRMNPQQALLQCYRMPGSRGVQLQRSFTGTCCTRVRSNGCRWSAAQWLENSAEEAVAVPLETAWAMWDRKESIPQWMPLIKSVEVQAEDPSLSRWLLSAEQFGRSWEFSWLAKNLTPIRYQKIHWRSVPGSSTMGTALDVANRGQIRFRRTSATTCVVKLTISYEVPDVLAPLAGNLRPVVEGILQRDMKRFAVLALEQQKLVV